MAKIIMAEGEMKPTFQLSAKQLEGSENLKETGAKVDLIISAVLREISEDEEKMFSFEIAKAEVEGGKPEEKEVNEIERSEESKRQGKKPFVFEEKKVVEEEEKEK